MLENAADQRTKVEFFSEEESSYSNDVPLLETDVLETGSPPAFFARITGFSIATIYQRPRENIDPFSFLPS